jgi:hypothetical protein
MVKQRKARVTKEMVKQIREEKKVKAKKNKIQPGPWSDVETSAKVKPELRITAGIVGEMRGSYARDEFWAEKGWYPININLKSANMLKEIKKVGLDEYLAAWEKAINSEKFKKEFGNIILLSVSSDHSAEDSEEKRFISCRAKTNKKSISGFFAVRGGKCTILE